LPGGLPELIGEGRRRTARSAVCSGQMNASSQARAAGSARLTGCWSMPRRLVICGTGPRIWPAGLVPRTSQEIVTLDAPAGDVSWPPTR